MLNQLCEFMQAGINMQCKRVITLLISLFLLFAPQVYASGAYMPGGSPQAKSQYNEGKMTYHQQIKSQKFIACMECYKKNKMESKCESVRQCVTSNVSDSQVKSLRYFLKKRYRLN